MTKEQIKAINDTFSFLRMALSEPRDEAELYHRIQHNIKAMKEAEVDSEIIEHVETIMSIYG